MLDYIRLMGTVIKNAEEKPDPVELFQKVESGKEELYDEVIEININDDPDLAGNFVSVGTKESRRSILKEGLFYVKGRTYIGAALRQNQYVSDKRKEKRDEAKKAEDQSKIVPIRKRKSEVKEIKATSNVSKCLQFLGIPLDRLKEVNSKLDATLAEKFEANPKYKYIVLFTRNGKKPIELEQCRQKFFDTYKSLVLHPVKGKPGYCHLCNKSTSLRYDTCGLDCYTNDKAVYNKTYGGTFYDEDSSDKDRTLSFSVCDDCLLELLYGERFVSQYLTVRWGGVKNTKVIFLPRDFNEDIKRNFEVSSIGDDPEAGLLSQIQTDETGVLKNLNNQNYSMDIMFVFDPPGRSEWKILYIIENVKSSRFAKVAELQQKYQTRGGKTTEGKEKKIKTLLLKEVIYYLVGDAAEKKGFPAYDDIFSTREGRHYLDVILHGTKLNNNEFFAHIMKILWNNYSHGKEKECMMTVHRVYNFMADCGCLDGGWDMPIYVDGKNMTAPYLSIDELFDRNSERFSSDFKKAWFLLGNVYGSIRRDSKSARLDRSGNYVTKILENGYMIDRKFTMDDFNQIVRNCWEYTCSHNTDKYIKTRLSRAIDLIGTGFDPENLSADEKAMYFVWGQTQYIGADREEEETPEAEEAPETEDENTEAEDENTADEE